jgi:hypothetical protein
VDQKYHVVWWSKPWPRLLTTPVISCSPVSFGRLFCGATVRERTKLRAATVRRGHRDLSYVEGQTITIDERGSDGRNEQLSADVSPASYRSLSAR